MFTAELKTNIKLSQTRSVSASISETVESKSKVHLEEMHSALEDVVKPYLTEDQGFKATYKEKPVRGEGKMISDKQLGYLKKLLKTTGTSETAFCHKYSVHKVEDLSMEAARTAIQDLKTTNLFDN